MSGVLDSVEAEIKKEGRRVVLNLIHPRRKAVGVSRDVDSVMRRVLLSDMDELHRTFSGQILCIAGSGYGLKFQHRGKCEPDVAKTVVDPARAWPEAEVGRSGPGRRCCMRAHAGATMAQRRPRRGLTALPVCTRYAGGYHGRIAARKCGAHSYSGISVFTAGWLANRRAVCYNDLRASFIRAVSCTNAKRMF